MRCVLATLVALLSLGSLAAAEPLRVCTTIPDLGDLVRQVGGDQVVVTVFARAADDPHFVEARPSFTKALARADMLVVVGLELEIGWVPVLQEQARNPRVQVGGPGYVDASVAVDKLGVPAAGTDRSHGDVHAGGNPHYLSDPANGLRVAELLCTRLTALSPANAAVFSANWERFARRVAIAMFGERAGSTVPPQELIARIEQETSAPSAEIGGWFADLRHVRGLKVVSDHDLWPYLAGRFGLSVIGFLEPKPGIAPTTSHLTGLIEYMATAKAQAILTTPFFEPRHARLVAERTGAVIIPLAHQIGALPGTADYIALIDRNVQALRSGLTPKP